MKIFAFLLAVVLSLSAVVGCGDDKSEITPEPSASPYTSQNENNVNMGTGAASDAADSMGDAAKSITDGAGNAVKDAVDGVENAVGDMAK